MKLHNAHDKFAKEAFADKDRAIAFFEVFLPPELLVEIDIKSLSVLQESYITDELEEYFSDLVFDVPIATGDNKLSISLLFEHKSTPDKYIQIQLGHYLFNHWLKALKNKEPIRPIIPIVYYQGTQQWEIPTLADLFEDYPALITDYLPTFNQIYIPIQSLTEDQIFQIKNALMISAIFSQRFTLKPEKLEAELARIYQLLPTELKRGNFITTIFVYTLQYATFDKSQISKIMDNIAKPLQKDFISTYDMIVQEGRQEGEMAKNVEVIVKGHKNGIDSEMLANLTGLPEEQVKQILIDQGVEL